MLRALVLLSLVLVLAAAVGMAIGGRPPSSFKPLVLFALGDLGLQGSSGRRPKVGGYVCGRAISVDTTPHL